MTNVKHGDKMTQLQLPGFEECNFQCLTNCPLPPGQDCLWDDPDLDREYAIEYSEFDLWRETHKVHRDPGGVTPRCPRCYSTKVRISYPYIKCLGCRYSEFLIDFPISSNAAGARLATNPHPRHSEESSQLN